MGGTDVEVVDELEHEVALTPGSHMYPTPKLPDGDEESFEVHDTDEEELDCVGPGSTEGQDTVLRE